MRLCPYYFYRTKTNFYFNYIKLGERLREFKAHLEHLLISNTKEKTINKTNSSLLIYVCFGAVTHKDKKPYKADLSRTN